MARVEVLLGQKKVRQAHKIMGELVKENNQDCEVLMTFVKVNWNRGFERPVRSNSNYVTQLCPERSDPYLYLGLVADKFFNKKEAKKQFKQYLKMGGNKNLLPKGY